MLYGRGRSGAAEEIGVGPMSGSGSGSDTGTERNPMRLERIRIVLHRPSSAENLGAAARVMMNFGLSRLVLVEPPAWAGPPRSGGAETGRADVLSRARRAARHASPPLAPARLHAGPRGA